MSDKKARLDALYQEMTPAQRDAWNRIWTYLLTPNPDETETPDAVGDDDNQQRTDGDDDNGDVLHRPVGRG